MKRKNNKRHWIQLVVAVLTNGYLQGFVQGKIFKGKSKLFCVPGLNCYSCPGALGSCPIGSLQAVLGDSKYQIAFYVLGFIMLFGVILGRFVCGFLCPFGFVQDLLYKIKAPKIKMPPRIDKPLRLLKYFILAIFVLILPMFAVDAFGIAPPYFCKWICPAGTLEGGIPLVLKNESLQKAIGFLFNWKVILLAIIVLASIFIYRPFCKYICPLGAFYSVFNKFSFYQMQIDRTKCTGCKACERQCKMQVNILKNINSTECIRCGECKYVCKQGAISSGFTLTQRLQKTEEKI